MAGMGGHLAPEWGVTMLRNIHLFLYLTFFILKPIFLSSTPNMPVYMMQLKRVLSRVTAMLTKAFLLLFLVNQKEVLKLF